MTVQQLLANLDARELVEWEIYFRLEHENAKRQELADRARTGVQRTRKRR